MSASRAWANWRSRISPIRCAPTGFCSIRRRRKGWSPGRANRSARFAVMGLAALLLAARDRGGVFLAELPPPRRGPRSPCCPSPIRASDPKEAYFADGITEDLITDLAKMSALDVISRNSVFKYKGQPAAPREVARELGVRYVVEGSVRRSGDQIRINAQLIDTATGVTPWAEKYRPRAPRMSSPSRMRWSAASSRRWASSPR